MRDEQDAILDDLLSRWHSWQLANKTTRGYAPKALVCGDYRISRQYDDVSGALDDDLDNLRSRQVDHEVRQMGETHRAAIYTLARNLATGREVWFSPRLPQDKPARDAIVREARNILIGRLVASGVI